MDRDFMGEKLQVQITSSSFTLYIQLIFLCFGFILKIKSEALGSLFVILVQINVFSFATYKIRYSAK